VKRSGRDEPMWVVIHKYMEATLGISLYSYLYLKLAKTLCLSYYLLYFLFNKIGEEGRIGFAWKWGFGGVVGWGKVAQTMYTHVSKYKNDKIKGEKRRGGEETVKIVMNVSLTVYVSHSVEVLSSHHT
jgi:hypothetical protein